MHAEMQPASVQLLTHGSLSQARRHCLTPSQSSSATVAEPESVHVPQALCDVLSVSSVPPLKQAYVSALSSTFVSLLTWTMLFAEMSMSLLDSIVISLAPPAV